MQSSVVEDGIIEMQLDHSARKWIWHQEAAKDGRMSEHFSELLSHIKSRSTGASFVLGRRGSGKSYLLLSMWRELLQKPFADSNPLRLPRIPVYINIDISDWRDETEGIKRWERFMMKGITNAVVDIINLIKDAKKNDLYIHPRFAPLYNIEEEVQKTSRNFDEFTSAKISDLGAKLIPHLRPIIMLDDFDKADEKTTIDFMSRMQDFISGWFDQGAYLIFSSHTDTQDAMRNDPRCNWVVPSDQGTTDYREVAISGIGTTEHDRAMEIINDRFSHLHQSGESNNTWVYDREIGVNDGGPESPDWPFADPNKLSVDQDAGIIFVLDAVQNCGEPESIRQLLRYSALVLQGSDKESALDADFSYDMIKSANRRGLDKIKKIVEDEGGLDNVHISLLRSHLIPSKTLEDPCKQLAIYWELDDIGLDPRQASVQASKDDRERSQQMKSWGKLQQIFEAFLPARRKDDSKMKKRTAGPLNGLRIKLDECRRNLLIDSNQSLLERLRETLNLMYNELNDEQQRAASSSATKAASLFQAELQAGNVIEEDQLDDDASIVERIMFECSEILGEITDWKRATDDMRIQCSNKTTEYLGELFDLDSNGKHPSVALMGCLRNNDIQVEFEDEFIAIKKVAAVESHPNILIEHADRLLEIRDFIRAQDIGFPVALSFLSDANLQTSNTEIKRWWKKALRYAENDHLKRLPGNLSTESIYPHNEPIGFWKSDDFPSLRFHQPLFDGRSEYRQITLPVEFTKPQRKGAANFIDSAASSLRQLLEITEEWYSTFENNQSSTFRIGLIEISVTGPQIEHLEQIIYSALSKWLSFSRESGELVKWSNESSGNEIDLPHTHPFTISVNKSSWHNCLKIRGMGDEESIRAVLCDICFSTEHHRCCRVCGEINGHATRRCPEQVCRNCRHKGHRASDCSRR